MKFFRKKEVWLPTATGLLSLCGIAVLLAYATLSGLYPFLAQNDPNPDARAVIIEGWLGDAELEELAGQLPTDGFIVTTGGPITLGSELLKEKTYADVTATRLRLLGFDAEKMICAPAPDVQCDRTYAAALAARDALVGRGLSNVPCNIYSTGAHGRRSFYLYRLAFGSEWPLGIVSVENQEYDLRRWWRSSLAFKNILGEALSWIYTLLSSCKYA